MAFDPAAFAKSLSASSGGTQPNYSPVAPVASSSGKNQILGALLNMPTGSQQPAVAKAPHRSWFANTLDWLSSGGQAVENALLDISKGIAGQKSGLQSALGVGEDLGAGLLGYAKPIVDLGPIHTPWEKSVNDFLDKNKSTFHNQEVTRGTTLLNQWGWKPTNTWYNKAGRGVVGFAADVASDPLTYVGPGAFVKGFKVALHGSEDAALAARLGYRGSNFERDAIGKAINIQEPIAQREGVLRSTAMPEQQIQDTLKSEFPTQFAEREQQLSKLQPVQKEAVQKDYERSVLSHNPLVTTQQRGLTVYQGMQAMGKLEKGAIIGAVDRHGLLKTPVTKEELGGLGKGVTLSPEAQTVEKVLGEHFKVPAGKIRGGNPTTWMKDALENQRLRLPDGSLNPVMLEHIANTAKQEILNGTPVEALRSTHIIPEATAPVAQTAIETAGSAAKNLKAGASVTPGMQAALFERLSKSGLQGNDLLSALKVGEEHQLANGLKLVGDTGQSLRLSHVLESFGPQLTKLTPEQLTSVVKAFSSKSGYKALDPALAVDFNRAAMVAAGRNAGVRSVIEDNLTKQFLDKYGELRNITPPAAFKYWVGQRLDDLAKQFKDVGFSGAEADAFKQNLTGLVRSEQLAASDGAAIYAKLQGPLAKSFEMYSKGIKLNALEHARMRWQLTRAVADRTGLNIHDSAFLRFADIYNRTARFWGDNFTTWYGRGFAKTQELEERTAGQAIAHARAQMLNAFTHALNLDQQRAAFNLAARFGGPANVNDIMTGATKTGESVLGAHTASGFTHPDPAVAQFADFLHNYFTEVFGPSSDFAKVLARGPIDSLAERSGMLATDINRHLKQLSGNSKYAFQFKPGDIKTGNWYDSWRDVKFSDSHENPITFLYNMDLAVQRVVTEYNVTDSFLAWAGKKVGEAGYDPKVHTYAIRTMSSDGHYIPKINRIPTDVRFSPEAGKAFEKLHADMVKGQWRPQGALSRFMAFALRTWKSSVTIYSPSHHIHNLVGDSWLMWTAGYNNPKVFMQGMKTLRSMRGYYGDALKNMDVEGFLGAITGKPVAEGKATDVIVHKNGLNLRADELYHAANSRGLLPGFTQIEDLMGNKMKWERQAKINIPSKVPVVGGKGVKPFAPAGGRIHDAAASLSEAREHYIRLTHMIAYIEKHVPEGMAARIKNAGPLERDALLKPYYDAAAQEVRKFHPDGTDMAYFEQRYVRNIIPFYSWTRKAIPLAMQAFLLHPAKITAYPKAELGLQAALTGNTQTDIGDPFPTDQLYPDWFRAAAIGPVADAQDTNPFTAWFASLGTNQVGPNGKERGYTIFNPLSGAAPVSTLTDLFGMHGSYEDISRGLQQQVTPFLKIPAELLAGKQMSGATLSPDKNKTGLPAVTDYLLNQFPQWQTTQSFADSNVKKKQNVEGGINWQAIINKGLGAGIQGTGQYIKTAELQHKDELAKQAKKKG